MKKLLGLLTHALALGVGFAAGIYALPILIAPAAPEASEVEAVAGKAQFSATFRRDLEGSDTFHWGEGKVTVTADAIALQGKLAPGPDYKLYLSPEFVQTEAEFLKAKATMVRVGDVKTFDNFIVKVPPSVDPAQYTTVVVWCESFGQFITAAQYR